MIIQIDSMIKEAKTIDDLKPLLLIIVKALNTMDDAKRSVKGDLMLLDGGLVLRCADESYKKLTLVMSGGYPAIQLENIGSDPKPRIIE